MDTWRHSSVKYSTTLTHLRAWWLLRLRLQSTGTPLYGRTDVLLAKAEHYFIVWKDETGQLRPPDPSQQHWANKKKVFKVCAEMNEKSDHGTPGEPDDGEYVVAIVTGKWTMEEA